MGNWYQVVKTINGRKYLYWQKTYRVGVSVKTLNKYIGPAANPPRMRSLAAQMATLPEAHKQLRADFDAGKITKAARKGKRRRKYGSTTMAVKKGTPIDVKNACDSVMTPPGISQCHRRHQ